VSINVEKVTKNFGQFKALKEISLEVKTGELVALLGPSGSGKTTLLRVIAGLETADEGRVFFHGEDISSRKIKERAVGFVFQHYALFRNMNVFENIAFGLRVRPRKIRPSQKEIVKTVARLLHLVRLEGLGHRYPSELSGGQRQRVALARALAIEPKVLLLDEPFGALDAQVRKELRQWLRELHDRLHMTSVFVTHDQEEALELADRIVVMNEGNIEQIGTPDEVYHHPKNYFVYHFLGDVNLFHGRADGTKVTLGNTEIEVASSAASVKTGDARIYIRPHMLEIQRQPSDKSFPAAVRAVNTAGPIVRIELTTAWGDSFSVVMSQERYRQLEVKKDESVHVSSKEDENYMPDYTI